MALHGPSSPKSNRGFYPETFDMSQNVSNPFNPTTTIRYSVPELSQVSITVMDMLGYEAATLVRGIVEPGVRTVKFDATNLGSGMYVATTSMRGLESGLKFTKTIRMTLSK